jgi:hypothetical protein
MILAEWMGDAIIKDRGPSAKREVAFSREENDVIDPCHPPPSHLFDVGALFTAMPDTRSTVFEDAWTDLPIWGTPQCDHGETWSYDKAA